VLTIYKEVSNKYIWGELMVNIIPDIKVGNKGTRLRIRLTKVKDDIPPDQITGDPSRTNSIGEQPLDPNNGGIDIPAQGADPSQGTNIDQGVEVFVVHLRV